MYQYNSGILFYMLGDLWECWVFRWGRMKINVFQGINDQNYQLYSYSPIYNSLSYNISLLWYSSPTNLLQFPLYVSTVYPSFFHSFLHSLSLEPTISYFFYNFPSIHRFLLLASSMNPLFIHSSVVTPWVSHNVIGT